ncbi:TetR/AcrR family transcriptional regulator [Actinoplanes subglobosus]|uniref:TetR/AcrR family transcriptional regulator n=1 Tax=Actinoplanes subglobosus TaxID=1547892 RepID=A0ABV8J9D0_9ACTN
MTEPGLRERKKAATRAALSRTAWTMMLEQGLDAVTPESVAAAADMAPRTFRYHFRNREEAILDELAQQHTRLAGLLRESPADEPIWDCLHRVVPPAVAGFAGDRGDFAKLIAVIAANPSMLAQNLLMLENVRGLLATAIGERTGTDPHADPYPGLLAGAVTTAISLSVAHWATDSTTTPLPELVGDCLTRFRAGLPAPAAPETGT